MSNIFYIRTTKFPYVFWAFNKTSKCNIDLKNLKYQNLELNNNFNLKPFNFFGFLFLKYIGLILIFLIIFNRYDFCLNLRNIISYALALSLFLSVNFLDNLIRKIFVVSLFFLSFFLAFYINDLFLSSYMIKYFLFLTFLSLFCVDFKYKVFSICDDENKVISHCLIDKNLIKKEN